MNYAKVLPTSDFFVDEAGNISYLVPMAIACNRPRFDAQVVQACRLLAEMNRRICGNVLGPCNTISVFNVETD